MLGKEKAAAESASTDAKRYDDKALQIEEGYNGVKKNLTELIQGGYKSNRWANKKLIDHILRKGREHPAMSICEWGCYYGVVAVYLSKELPQARVRAFDISERSIQLANRLNYDFDGSAEFFCGDAVNLSNVEDGTIDLAYGFGVLHHVHRRETFEHLFRVLSSGGEAIFVEPTAFNPLIRLYRLVRPEPYSPHETPYNAELLQQIQTWLPNAVVSWRGEHLLSTLYLFSRTLIGRLPRRIRDSARFKRLADSPATSLGQIDDALLSAVPALQRGAQLVTVSILKK